MYKSRLDKLLDNEEVLKGVLNHDVGVMVYQDEETVSYLILSY